MAMDFQDTADYQRLLDETEFAVSIELRGSLVGGSVYNKLTIDLPRVKYRRVGVPITAGEFITQDVECTVLKPNSSDIATVTLVNGSSAAAAGL
jgi:cephalosporin hydroxylase